MHTPPKTRKEKLKSEKELSPGFDLTPNLNSYDFNFSFNFNFKLLCTGGGFQKQDSSKFYEKKSKKDVTVK